MTSEHTAYDFVYVTSDYSLFKELPDNRDVLEFRFNRLVKSFSEKEVINPIIVNSDMQIIDGQARFEVKKYLGLPIYYIIDPNADINDCRRMNAYNKPWDANEFIVSYAKSGNQNYITLKNLIEETKLPYTRIMRIASKGRQTSSGSQSTIRDGLLKFTNDEAVEVKLKIEKVKQIINALCFTGSTNDAFWTACCVIFDNPNYDHNSFLKNCAKSRSTYTQMSKLPDQLKEFSRIANLGKRSTSKVYFEDYMRNKGKNLNGHFNAGNYWGDSKNLKTLKDK